MAQTRINCTDPGAIITMEWIEVSINEALVLAYSDKKKGLVKDMTTDHIYRALKETFPLSETMKEEIESSRKWASTHARPANEKDTSSIQFKKPTRASIK